MGQRNFVIEGVSGSGKTTVCDELIRRGYHAVHGDRALRPHPRPAGPDQSAAEAAAWVHQNALWDPAKVQRHLNTDAALSFFCGGFRNHADLLPLFDGVFILDLDAETLTRRLSTRPADEFGGQSVERDLILRLHATQEDMPPGGTRLDATRPVGQVVDEILRRVSEM